MDWKHEHPKYTYGSLEDGQIPHSPWSLWQLWQEEAKSVLHYTNEIALATSDTQGSVSVRMVLLKHASEADGFCWYTNRQSQKGRQLTDNPQAEILWYVKEHQRQIRVHGTVSEVSRASVLDYAHSRPFRSQVSALISQQSAPIDSKESLRRKFDAAIDLYKEYEDSKEKKDRQKITCPDSWTGFTLLPQRFEFWQGNSDRLHDRIVFSKQADGAWAQERLQP